MCTAALHLTHHHAVSLSRLSRPRIQMAAASDTFGSAVAPESEEGSASKTAVSPEEGMFVVCCG